MVLKPIFPLNFLPLIFFAGFFSMGSSGCPIYNGQVVGKNFKTTIDSQRVPGVLNPNDELQFFSITLPSDEIFSPELVAKENISEASINTIAIRTVIQADLNDTGHLIDGRMHDAKLVGPCEGGQDRLDFVKAINVYVRKAGELESRRIGHFCNSLDEEVCPEESDRPTMVKTDFCGLFVEMDIDKETGMPYDLKRFLPEYEIIGDAVITYPSKWISVSGFVGVDWIYNVQAE